MYSRMKQRPVNNIFSIFPDSKTCVSMPMIFEYVEIVHPPDHLSNVSRWHSGISSASLTPAKCADIADFQLSPVCIFRH